MCATTINQLNSATVSNVSGGSRNSSVDLTKSSIDLRSTNRSRSSKVTGSQGEKNNRSYSDEISFTYDPKTQELVADPSKETEEILEKTLNDIISPDQDGYTFDEAFENKILNQFSVS